MFSHSVRMSPLLRIDFFQPSGPLDFDDIMSSLALAKRWFTVSTNAESLCCVIVHIVANSTFQPAEADVTLKILDDHFWVVFIRGRRASERQPLAPDVTGVPARLSADEDP